MLIGYVGVLDPIGLLRVDLWQLLEVKRITNGVSIDSIHKTAQLVLVCQLDLIIIILAWNGLDVVKFIDLVVTLKVGIHLGSSHDRLW